MEKKRAKPRVQKPTPASETRTEATGVKKNLPPIRGVFSTLETQKVGMGVTTRKISNKVLWFVEERGDELECQPINRNFVPSGAKRSISREEFFDKYSPEPEIYHNSVYPKMRELAFAIEDGDRHREKGETFTAEFEYKHALDIDEENIRANFGIGLTYLERKETDKANDIFLRLVKLQGAFAPEHKHLFNEFGIRLRKSGLFVQAAEYYERALELHDSDENLHTNLARAKLELKDFDACLEHIFKALELDPGSAIARKFLEWVAKKALIPEHRKDEAAFFLGGDAEN